MNQQQQYKTGMTMGIFIGINQIVGHAVDGGLSCLLGCIELKDEMK